MIIRKIGKIIRGKATPLQLMLACVLGSMLAFVPGFQQGPGLILALLAVLLVLNANLAAALLTFIPAKLLSLAMMPVTFAIGRFLLDGPTQGLFQGLINAPVLAWFGFEYYATTGGLVPGLIVGLVTGWLLVRSLTALRKKLAAFEEGSERYQKLTSKFWVKLLLFLFVGGGHGKKTYAELAQFRIGNPVRIAGVVVVVVLLAGGWFVQGLLAEPVLTSALKSQLESANGATVDLASVELDLGEGRLSLNGLALADPEELATDLFRALQIQADVSTTDLARKRLAIDRLVISRASNGEPRETPGERIGDPPQPSEPEPAAGEGEKTIEDYLREAEIWKERLAQAREWLEKLSEGDETAGQTEEEREESLRERLEREVRELGYANVQAGHLIQGAPSLLISELVVEELVSTRLAGETLDVRALNLSTSPSLVEGAPSLAVSSKSGNLELALGLDALSADPARNRVLLAWRGLSTDAVAGGLSVGGESPVQGGTIDLSLDGSWAGGRVGEIELPLRVVVRDATVRAGGQSAKVTELVLPIDLRGPIDAPRITVDGEALQQALLKAGADELAAKARAELDKHTGELQEKLGDKLGDELGKGLGDKLGKDAGKLLDDLPFGKKKDKQ